MRNPLDPWRPHPQQIIHQNHCQVKGPGECTNGAVEVKPPGFWGEGGVLLLRDGHPGGALHDQGQVEAMRCRRRRGRGG